MAKNRELMSDAELKEEAMQKTKSGSFTRSALAAQREIWNRITGVTMTLRYLTMVLRIGP